MSEIELDCKQLWAQRLRSALAAEGISTWEQLAGVSPATLLTYKHVGRMSLEYMNRELAARGLAFSGEYQRSSIIEPIQTARPRSGVYFVRCQPFVKIGYSSDLSARIESIRGAVPFATSLA